MKKDKFINMILLYYQKNEISFIININYYKVFEYYNKSKDDNYLLMNYYLTNKIWLNDYNAQFNFDKSNDILDELFNDKNLDCINYIETKKMKNYHTLPPNSL